MEGSNGLVAEKRAHSLALLLVVIFQYVISTPGRAYRTFDAAGAWGTTIAVVHHALNEGLPVTCQGCARQGGYERQDYQVMAGDYRPVAVSRGYMLDLRYRPVAALESGAAKASNAAVADGQECPV